MIIPIRLYGDPCLKEVAYDVELNDVYGDLVHDMLETLKASYSGVGLAATQVGIPLRIFVTNYKGMDTEFINPVIVSTGDEKSTEAEGCLSIPNVEVKVERYKNIRVSYQVIGENGELVNKLESFDDMEARIIQHEIDHLDGICITDYAKGLSKRLMKSKLDEIIKGRKKYRYNTLHVKDPQFEKLNEINLDKYFTEEE